MPRFRFVVGLSPDLPAIRAAGLEVLEEFEGPATGALVQVPIRSDLRLNDLFRGVFHVYDSETEARRVWGLFEA